MNERVVSLDGDPIAHSGNPDPDVVAKLEELLAAAKAGRLGIVAGAVKIDREYHHFVVGSGGVYEVLGALEMAKIRVSSVYED